MGVHTALGRFQRAMRPGAFLVDRIPILKYLPGYGKEMDHWHRYEIKLFREQLARVENEMARRNQLYIRNSNHRPAQQATTDCGPSFARTLLEHVHEDEMPTDEMAYLAGSMYGAGSETVFCPLYHDGSRHH